MKWYIGYEDRVNYNPSSVIPKPLYFPIQLTDGEISAIEKFSAEALNEHTRLRPYLHLCNIGIIYRSTIDTEYGNNHGELYLKRVPFAFNSREEAMDHIKKHFTED